jgi:thioesterase domain-containing protein
MNNLLQQRLQSEIDQTIPLVRALAPIVTQASDGIVCFRTPLAPNINDKGCAFGGSLASLMTLACWSVLRVETWTHELAAEIFVHTSKIVYRAPIWTDFVVRASATPEALDGFVTTLKGSHKAALILHAEVFAIGDDGNPTGECAATLEARFVGMLGAAE